MADYILYPTSIKGLAEEMIKLVDDYQAKRTTQDILISTLSAWEGNCDFMFDRAEDGSVVLASGLLRLIGKKRNLVVSKVLGI